ncbi:unnamed protein product [Porites lobata]|uniref:Uncharacterized protein n=1 Tax=Porites lobata TaxID=104759 RepID=A0ABN8NPG0_9CNID|nr:unnamed protein product [Porites lobata]
MARTLTGNATLELPRAAKCCEIVRSGQKVVNCHRCQEQGLMSCRIPWVNKGQQIVHMLLGDKFKEQLDILRMLLSNALFDEKLEQV